MKIMYVGMISSMLFLAACNTPPSTDQVQQQRQEQVTMNGVNSVGIPAVKNFTEMRNMKMLYELRDRADLATITYITDLNGKLHKICDSIGYGIPYAEQFTNPEKVAVQTGYGSWKWFVLPQAEPNGLFTPQAADGTWVMCIDPNEKVATQKIKPIYVEPHIVVSQFALETN